MIACITGRLAAVDDQRALIQTDSGVAFAVLLPPYLEATLRAADAGSPATLHTVCLMESPNQGVTLLPRLMGFATEADRDVFELLTTVKGLGHRRALRAIAEPPQEIAAAIARGDEVSLRRLPEIGAKLAKAIVEALGPTLRDRLAIEEVERASTPEPKHASPAVADAIRALVSLGEQAANAERKVEQASRSMGPDAEAGDLVATALSL
ncbi:MAG: Holliday junction branch migration protein RuvA [Planctomycetota bacterium]